MDPSLHTHLQYAVTHNTPLKIRSTSESIPPSGKILQAQDINQDLLVELDGATLNEDPLTNDSHYVLAQCDEISPSTDHLPQAPAGGPLKITSLELQNQVLYHDDHWDSKELPHILRTPSPTGSESRSQKARLRRESICRVIPGTSQEESIEGTFLPNAGAEEEWTARWLNKVTEALVVLDPTRGPLTRGRSAATRFWSSETSRKPFKDNMMIVKPDLILRENRIGPRPEFSWDGVISFLELTSSPFQDSAGVGNVRNAIMRKAYALFASQPGRRFLFALSIAKQEFRVHMFDRAGVVNSRGYDIHRSPRTLLRMLSLLAFGHPEQIGYDITLTYSTPVPRLLSNSKLDFGVISVKSHTYTIIRKVFYGYLICGRATSCWHVKRNNKNYVIKDAWTHESREFREEDILNKIKDLEGVPRLVDAWTVEIKGLQDRTRTRRSALLPSNNEVRVHRRLVMQPVAIPLTDFTSIRELVSVLIDILDVHQKLVIDFHILHRDISLNNIMIYVISTLAKDHRVRAGGPGTSPATDDHSELQVPVDENAVAEEETHEQKLARWEGERLQMIQAGELRRGILVDFDYATTMQPGQSKPVGAGARTGTIPFMSANILLHYKKPDTVHSASDDIESLIYVLIWICILYAGPKTLRHDKHATDTILNSWVSVCTPVHAVALGIHKKGIRTEPKTITEEFTIFFQPLGPIVEKLLTSLGNTWSTVDTMHNYKIVRDILLEGFGTVKDVPDWSPAKDAYGYGLIRTRTGSGPGAAKKRPSYATEGYDEAESSSRPSVRRRRH